MTWGHAGMENMKAIDAIRTGFAKSFQFSGRASRAEFWRRFGGQGWIAEDGGGLVPKR